MTHLLIYRKSGGITALKGSTLLPGNLLSKNVSTPLPTDVEKGDYDFQVLKPDANDGLEWEQSYGGSSHDYAEAIQQTDDGGYVVAGYSKSSDGDTGKNKVSWDVWVAKIDAHGELEWEQSYTGFSRGYVESIRQTSSRGYILAGFTEHAGKDKGDYNFWVLILDAKGALEWGQSFGGSSYDYAEFILLTSDGVIFSPVFRIF